MTAQKLTLGIGIDASGATTGADTVSRSLAQIARDAHQAASAMARLNKHVAKTATSSKTLTHDVTGLLSALTHTSMGPSGGGWGRGAGGYRGGYGGGWSSGGGSGIGGIFGGGSGTSGLFSLLSKSEIPNDINSFFFGSPGTETSLPTEGLIPGSFGGSIKDLNNFNMANVGGIASSIVPGLVSGNYTQAALGGVGAIAGSLIPGVGTMLGGAIGNTLGGLIGGGKPPQHHTYRATSTINSDGTTLLYNQGGDHGDEYKSQVLDSVTATSTYLQNLQKSTGAKYGPAQFAYNVASVGDNGQAVATYELDDGTHPPTTYSGDDKGLAQLSIDLLKASSGLGDATKTILDHTKAQTTAALSADLAFGKAYDTVDEKLANLATPVSRYQAALDQLKTAYDQQTATAGQLGLSVGKLTDLYTAQKGQLVANLDADLGSKINLANNQGYLNQVDSVLGNAKRYAADAASLGVDRTGQIASITASALDAVFAKLDTDQLDKVKAAYATNVTVIGEVNKALDGLKSSAEATAAGQQAAMLLDVQIAHAGPTVEEFTRQMQSASEGFAAAASAAQASANSLLASARGLTLGSLSPLTGADKAAQAAIYYQQSQTTQNGDAYLQATASAYGISSDTYAEAYRSVLSNLVSRGAAEAGSAAYNASLSRAYARVADAGGALGIGDANYDQAAQAEAAARDAFLGSTGIQRFAAGGMVGGGTPGFDSVPALLTPGEGVLTTTGMATLDRLNQGAPANGNAPPADTATDRVAAALATLTEEVAGLRADNATLTRRLDGLAVAQVAPIANRR